MKSGATGIQADILVWNTDVTSIQVPVQFSLTSQQEALNLSFAFDLMQCDVYHVLVLGLVSRNVCTHGQTWPSG